MDCASTTPRREKGLPDGDDALQSFSGYDYTSIFHLGGVAPVKVFSFRRGYGVTKHIYACQPSTAVAILFILFCSI